MRPPLLRDAARLEGGRIDGHAVLGKRRVDGNQAGAHVRGYGGEVALARIAVAAAPRSAVRDRVAGADRLHVADGEFQAALSRAPAVDHPAAAVAGLSSRHALRQGYGFLGGMRQHGLVAEDLVFEDLADASAKA